MNTLALCTAGPLDLFIIMSTTYSVFVVLLDDSDSVPHTSIYRFPFPKVESLSRQRYVRGCGARMLRHVWKNVKNVTKLFTLQLNRLGRSNCLDVIALNGPVSTQPNSNDA